MQLTTLAPRLIPASRPSASHANFDVLATTAADGTQSRLGLHARSRFWMHRGSSWDDAVAGAKELAGKQGSAFAVLAAHPGQLFVVPVFVRAAEGSPAADTQLGADLLGVTGTTLAGRHGTALAIVGANEVLDLRPVPVTLGSGRG